MTVPWPDRIKPIPLPPTMGRSELVALAREITPHLREDDTDVSVIVGGRRAADTRLNTIDPARYGQTRNDLVGAVTQLSPFITHGVLSLSEVRDAALNAVDTPDHAQRMIQQLAWRDYWQRLYAQLGDKVWDDIEDYKTGFSPSDYADEMPRDIAKADTGVAAIDHFITQLIRTGWLHNHARLYLASYICHFRRVKWQAGARFFLRHLLDGDPASNNLSWQWVASTFSHKPYYFNLENLQRFARGSDVDVSGKNNSLFDGSYEALHAQLFPNLPPLEPKAKS